MDEAIDSKSQGPQFNFAWSKLINLLLLLFIISQLIYFAVGK